jgi:hypothetical protein
LKPQNAFVQGRQILDLFCIEKECFDSRIRYGELGVLGKLNLGKAYDHANWDFLLVEIWFHGEMTLLDSTLYFFDALFHFGEWQSVRFFQYLPWFEMRRSFVTFSLCYCYGGLQ